MPIRPIGITIEEEMFKFETYLTAEAASAATTLTVKSITNFAINLILLIGELGDENSEIVKIHTTTAPTGTTVTLATALIKTHAPFTKIRVMLYDQVEISHAATVGGAKTVLSKESIVTMTIAAPAVVTLVGHGFITGECISLSTTGALPTGLAIDTDYFVIKIDADTFNLATTFANAIAGTKITTSGSQSGVHTLLENVNIQPESIDTRYDDATKSSGYFFTRFKNTILSTYSDYSDPIPYTGFGANTVAFAINYALKRNKLDSFTENVDYAFCIDEVNSCLQFITGKLKGWSKLLELNYPVGQTARGQFIFTLPTNIWEDAGNKSIQDVRIGTGTGLIYKIWSDFEKEMEGVKVTQVTTEVAAASVTLEIDNSYDFADAGSVSIYISGTLHTITYTGVTRSATAGVLTGVPASGTGAITVTIPADTYVWQGESEGQPAYYTIDDDGQLRIWPLASAVYDDKNVYLDYYTGPTSVDSDADTLDAFRYDAVKHWITWAIRMQIKNDGKRDFTDGDYIQFSQIIADYIRNEIPAHRKKRGVKINKITY